MQRERQTVIYLHSRNSLTLSPASKASDGCNDAKKYKPNHLNTAKLTYQLERLVSIYLATLKRHEKENNWLS